MTNLKFSSIGIVKRALNTQFQKLQRSLGDQQQDKTTKAAKVDKMINPWPFETDLLLFGLPAQKGRWLLIPLAVTVMLCLGTVYTWSIFRKPLEDLLNISATESVLPFTVLLAVNAMMMPITGFYIDKFGPRIVTAIGGVVTGLAYILSSLAGNLPSLVLTYGMIGGAGIGMTYGAPVAVAARWFPDKKGLALGLTVSGFGLSPVVTAPLAKYLCESYGVLRTFLYLGIAFTVIILAISRTLKVPPAGRVRAPSTISEVRTTPSPKVPMIRSQRFYGLWLCYAIGTFVGLLAISISSPVAQEIIKLEPKTAAICVSLFAIFNGAGRPGFGWLTDRIQPKNAAITSYVMILMGSLLMLSASEGQTTTYLIGFSLFWLSLGLFLSFGDQSHFRLDGNSKLAIALQ